MIKKDVSFWEEITVTDIKKLYLMVFKEYKELDNREWLQYMIIKEQGNRAWLLNVDSKIDYKGINPSLLFIWYAYTHLDSTNTNAAFIINEIWENTPERKNKKSQKQQIVDEKEILKTIDKEISVEEQRIWGTVFIPKVKKRKPRKRETLVEKTKRLVLERKKKEKEELERLAIEREKREKEELERLAIERERREKEERKKTALAVARWKKERKKKEELKRIETEKRKKEKQLEKRRAYARKRYKERQQMKTSEQLELKLSKQRKREENEAAIQRALRLYDERKANEKNDIIWVRKKS